MQETNISINEIIMYLRKSRSDDPYMTVEEVLARAAAPGICSLLFRIHHSGRTDFPGSCFRGNHCGPSGYAKRHEIP